MVSVLSPPPLFPPPPPPPSLRPILYYALVVVATAALSLALYNIIILKWCSEQQQHRRHHSRSQSQIDDHPIASNFRLISSFKFKKEMDHKVRDHEQGYEPPECSICLSVFEEDDELKRLPRCMHCFHAKCIDKWLISQFNCPLCRLEVEESTDGRRSKETNQLMPYSFAVVQCGLAFSSTNPNPYLSFIVFFMMKARLLSMEGNTSSPESTTVPSTPWIIDTVLLILLILLIFLLFLCYLMPSFLYNASGFLQPSSIKKCVNYFDVLLIIIAISSHLLSRYGSRSSSDTTSDRDNEIVTSQADTYSSKERFYDAQQKFKKGSLKRISNSYPDLRNESLWRIEEYGSRFFDDFDVDTYRPVQVADHCSCARGRRKKKVDSSVKEIPVDNLVVHPPTPPKSPPPEDSGGPEDSVIPIQTSHIQDKKIKPQLKSTDIWNFSEEIMSKRCGMKKSSSAKELATAIASSFIRQRERKGKQKMRNLHSSQSESSLSVTMEPDPSPSKVPSPPPPPPSIFYNLFKKGKKPKRIQTVNSAAPPPPPPPPQRSVLKKRFQSISEQLQLVSASTPSPSSPPPGAVHNRLLLLPPPPPLSELELADEKNSAGNGSDDLPYFGSPPLEEEDVNSVPSTIKSTTSGRDVSTSGWMICPTPDVNMKADSFIARLRGEWKEDGDHEFLQGGRRDSWDLGP